MISNLTVLRARMVDHAFMGLYKPEYFHLFFVLEGSGNLIVDSEHYPCRYGDCLFFSAFDVCVPHRGSAAPLNLIHLVFRCDCPDFAEHLKGIFGPWPHLAFARDTVLSILHAMAFHPPYFQEKADLLLANLVLMVLCQQEGPPPEFLTGDAIPQSPMLDQVLNYVKNHMEENFSLNDLSAEVPCTPRQLSDEFRKLLGQPPLQYINQLRLERAKELLCFSTASVTEIAEQTGFHSIHYFSRFFKEKEGCTPTEFKSCLERYFSEEEECEHLLS